MAPVKKAKSAFQFFQAECLGEVKRELGNGATMGDAMSVLSQRWKNLSESERAPYLKKEAEDRDRFLRDSAEADAIAIAEQESRRNKLIAKEGEDVSHRGARARIETERAAEEERRKKARQARLAAMDPEELAERRRLKAKKKAEALERQRRREEKERALAERHRKLDKAEAIKANKRLEYLLKQSSVFAKLKMGTSHPDHVETMDSKKPSEEKVSHHREGRPIKKSKGGDVEEDEEEGEQEEHVFLTKQPSCLVNGTLKPYQLEGLNWMIHLAEKGLNGILADEMGLGKTVQSISILAYHYEYMKVQGPHLVCVPKSTLSNWMNELKRWCPCLRAIRFHGNKDERAALVENYFTNDAAAHNGRRPDRQILNPETGQMEDDNSDNPRAWDVCVTTYEVCNTEKKTLGKFAWKYLVIDEAHRLKNEASMFSKTVREFKTAHRLLLTGTPLQNNLHELWALLNFLLPDIFSSSEQFDEWFDLEIDDEDAKKDMISQLHKILRPFMIRRLKSDVAKGLPPKTETLVMVGMSKMQKQLYKKLLLRDIESITGSTSSKNRTAILNIVMQLRKCCGHPYLFEGVEDRTLDPLGEHLVENCGKLTMVDKLLKKLKERGSRVLIFTQMTRILDILEDFMVMRGYKYCRIDGNTDYEAREAAIDQFNQEGSEKFCFILSTRAGGLGINLQTADTCILYDSDWNPQADLQAQDRCHRLGQKKPVSVYRLVSENTVEEKIVERAQQKLKLDAMVVQQGRLKDKDKVSKEEIMAAVRFGADTVFRSEESTITDEDIEVILERGRAKTKELADKLQKAEKGDLLDFRLDAGISAQTFEGVDYSDRELRNQLRLLAADSLGKRERRPPPTDYNPIMQPKKTMMVNNRKIKLPKSLRLPRMEDHQFYNRERLLELGKLEFQNYASLKQLGELPPREEIDKVKTLLPPELAQEKMELLKEGFGDWTRSQYFQFVKAAAKYGRDDLQSISLEMDLPVESVASYSASFWEYAPSELKADEWERVKATIEKGEQKIAKKRKLSSLLSKFVSTFANPRQEMTFANKGTQPFALEQDRALLCAVDKFGYGNWEAVREELRQDSALLFQHAVQGMNCDMIAKRCDYRMRQMEKECEFREKKRKGQKPPNVVAAEKSINAIKVMDDWEAECKELQLRGEEPPSLALLSDEAQEIMEERVQERQPFVDRIREIEIQVRGCLALAEETRKGILRGDQYVNYSNITLKAGGPHSGNPGSVMNGVIEKAVDIEAKINPLILRIPECGECSHCLDKKSRKLCIKRQEVRKGLLEAEPKMEFSSMPSEMNGECNGPKIKKGSKKRKFDGSPSVDGSRKGSILQNPKKKKKLSSTFTNRVTSLGNKRMSIPDELLPEFCRMIGATGTNERVRVINQFALEHPETSVRQVTFKFSEVTTRTLPGCVPEQEKKGGRAFMFYLRPRYYHLLPEGERPNDWEKYAQEDEILWKEEQRAEAIEKTKKEQKIRDMMEEATAKSQLSESESLEMSMGMSERASIGAATNSVDGDRIDSPLVPKKKKKAISGKGRKKEA